jgi:hypothetical protein
MRLLYCAAYLFASASSIMAQADHSSRPQIPAHRVEPIANSGVTLDMLAFIGQPPYCVSGATWAEQITKQGRHVLTKIERDGKEISFDALAQPDCIARGCRR